MASVNRVILLGRLGNQPELRKTANNNSVTELRIATDRRFKGRDDEWVEQTEWHSVVVWGKQAETCERYLNKGREVFVEGRLQTRDWEDQKTGQKRYKTEIVADRVQFVGGRGDGGSGGGGSDGGGGSWQGKGGGESATPQPAPDGGAMYDPEGDIPF